MSQIDFVTGFLSGFGITTIIVAFIENKFHVINRIKKNYSIWKNKVTDASLSLEYKPKGSFKEVKGKFKEIFRKEKDFIVIKETDTKMIFQYGIFSLTILENSQKNIFIGTSKISSGIKDLKERINTFLGEINKIEKTNVLGSFIDCDLSFSLPYKWDSINIWRPKGLEIKKYSISLSEKTFKSQVEISLNKVNLKSDTLQSLSYIIEKFL